MTCYHFKSRQAICTLVPKWLCQPEIGYTTHHFFQNQHIHYQIDFALFINNVGGYDKQSESNTTSTSSSASALASAVSADWLIAPPMQNVRVDTQYVGIIEEQKQQIGQLQEELAELNRV
jgi:hypothetical protein